MRLKDNLAARRRLYTFPLPTAPALLLIDVPPHYAGEGLPLGRFYPVIIESHRELVEFEVYLAAKRSEPVAPDLLATRPSRRQTNYITFFQYEPVEPGWPWLLLCHWPKHYTDQVEENGEMLARGAYTIETFTSRTQLLAAMLEMTQVLGSEICVHAVPPEGLTSGHA